MSFTNAERFEDASSIGSDFIGSTSTLRTIGGKIDKNDRFNSNDRIPIPGPGAYIIRRGCFVDSLISLTSA